MRLRAAGEPVGGSDIHDDGRWRAAARIEAYVVAAMWLMMIAMFAVIAVALA